MTTPVLEQNTDFANAIRPESAQLQASAKPILSLLSLIEGDVLVYVEENASVPLVKLLGGLEHSPVMILMAVGALMRRGLVRGMRNAEGSIIVLPV